MKVGGVLVSGSVVYDTLVHPAADSNWGTTTFVDTIEPHPGGNGTNTSLALAKARTPARLIASVGDDAPGQYLLEALCRSGVDTRFVRIAAGARTASTIGMINRATDRKFFHCMGVAASAFAEPIEFTPDLTAGMSHYHLASLFILPRLRAHAPETLARARVAGLTTSLDTNWDPQGRWIEDLRGCLPHLDIIFVNEDEGRMVTGCTTPESMARCLLAEGARAAVIKLGALGCAIYTAEDGIHVPGFDVDAKDTTGAGDCFVGGFLRARVAGAGWKDAGRYGNAMGALSVQNIGGASGIPDGIDLDSWMASAALRS
jgi:sugar/nucleoside kinase (ribokinase family)